MTAGNWGQPLMSYLLPLRFLKEEYDDWDDSDSVDDYFEYTMDDASACKSDMVVGGLP